MISDPGLPSQMSPPSLAKSRLGVASATVKARHPGPELDPSDILQRMVQGPLGQYLRSTKPLAYLRWEKDKNS